MDDITYWLPLVWAGLIGTAVALYIVLDGFDLGIGILFPFTGEEEQRDVMMNTVAPFWDGNETWLVMGGAGLFVAFPTAYAIIMPAFYLPIILMLLALVFRGVAFEFRWVAKPNHRLWDIAFSGGSITATFMQGIILGGLSRAAFDNRLGSGCCAKLAAFHACRCCSSAAGDSWLYRVRLLDLPWKSESRRRSSLRQSLRVLF